MKNEFEKKSKSICVRDNLIYHQIEFQMFGLNEHDFFLFALIRWEI